MQPVIGDNVERDACRVTEKSGQVRLDPRRSEGEEQAMAVLLMTSDSTYVPIMFFSDI